MVSSRDRRCSVLIFLATISASLANQSHPIFAASGDSLGTIKLAQSKGSSSDAIEDLDVPLDRSPESQTEELNRGGKKGNLTKQEIESVIRSNLRDIKNCYEGGLKAKSNLNGRVMTQFIIARNGRVKTAKVESSELNHSPTENCITNEIRRWQFPLPRGGGEVTVNYPFVFSDGEYEVSSGGPGDTLKGLDLDEIGAGGRPERGARGSFGMRGVGSGASESSQIQESIITREFPDGAKEFRDGPVSVRITSMGKDVPFEKFSDFEFQVSLSVKKIKECFENQQKTKPALRGHVNTKVFVSEKGKVTDVKIHLSNLLDDPTETCLLDEVRAWSFPVTKKKKRVVFVPFDFKGNRVKLTENPEATPAPDRKSPFEVIQDVIHGKLPQVQQCYVQRLRAKPKMAGKVNARFVISANGRVSSARIQSSELSDARTETCIRNTILKWTFPAPRDQKPMTLTYPFTFAPQ